MTDTHAPPGPGRDEPADAWPTASPGAGARGGPASAPSAAAVDRAARSEGPYVHESAAWIAGGAGSGSPRATWVRLVAMIAVIAAAISFFGPYALLMILALLVSIILHEFGHYWTAKRSGMKVTEFFVGFGPRIWSFRRGETEYGIKAIPAGAYVRIVGMNNLEDCDPADEPRTYRAQSSFKRVAVVLAGPAMNLLLAGVLFFGVFLAAGVYHGGWRVKAIQPGSAAAAAGLQPGDRVLRIDGQAVGGWDDFRHQMDHKAGQTVTLDVDRGGQQLTVTPTLGWRLSDTGARAIPSTPALEVADLVASADGKPVASFGDLKATLEASGPPVTLAIERNTHRYELIVNRPLHDLPAPADGMNGFLGLREEPVYDRETPLGALGEVGGTFKDGLVATGGVFGRLFTPTGLQNYAGQVADSTQTPTTVMQASQPGVLTPIGESPAANSADERPVSIIGIVHLGSDAADLGPATFISVIAGVNFALFLINLLPVLPFDGGHAAIGLYEGVRGTIRREPYRADLTRMLPIVYGVVALLIVLGLSSALIDILRPPSIR